MKWKRIYCEEGLHVLYEDQLGQSKNMSSKLKKKLSKKEKDLIAKNQRLQMENEYLKN